MGALCSSPLCTLCPLCPCCGYSGMGGTYNLKKRINADIDSILKKWLTLLTDLRPDLLLKKTSILASHDSGTYSISKYILGSSISRTQSIGLSEQLALGIRWVDFRFGGDKTAARGGPKELRICHGPHDGANYFKELSKISTFVAQNPQEFLIIDAKCERDINEGQRQYLINQYLRLFPDMLIGQNDIDTWANLETVTLGEIRKHWPKRIFLFVDRWILTPWITNGNTSELSNMNRYSVGELKNLGFLNKNELTVSKWHNTGSSKKLFNLIREDVERIDQNEGKLVNLQLILSPKVHLKAITTYCLCMNRTRIDQKHYMLMKESKLQLFVREIARKELHSVMTDFVNYDPRIPCFLIGLNFPFKLLIFEAYVKDGKNKKDVKQIIQDLVVRDNSLWIINLGQELGVKTRKIELYITYQFEEHQTVHKKIVRKSKEQYLLNCITHMDVTKDQIRDNKEMIQEYSRRKTSLFQDQSIFMKFKASSKNQDNSRNSDLSLPKDQKKLSLINSEVQSDQTQTNSDLSNKLGRHTVCGGLSSAKESKNSPSRNSQGLASGAASDKKTTSEDF